ncbi:MAG: portal protein, partial [Gammaproteobacteria bacterium]
MVAAAVDAPAAQLAASLLGEIAPPGARWCGLEPSAALDETRRQELAPALEASERLLQEHFAASNLSAELHQSLLDMVVAGTGCLLAEAAPPGNPSALRFQSVPLAELA